MAWEICHVCRMGWPHIGGMEAFVAGLAASQVERGHGVRVITLDRAITDGTPLSAGTHRGVAYERVPRVGPRRYPLARGLVSRVRGAHLVHVHGLDGLADTLVATRRLHRARVGVSTHGGYFHTSRHAWLKRAWLRTLTRVTLSRADAVWFTSEADRRTLSPAGITGEVLPDGVDISRFAAVTRRPEPGLWLVPGRVDAHKGHADLLWVLAALRDRGSAPERVEITGPERSPGLLDSLERQARELGLHDRVRLRGAVSEQDYLDLLARCELALFPSRYEGFGIGVIEAMAAGVVPVVSAIPAFDQLVRPGRDAFRVDFAHPEAAAQALERVRPDGRMSTRARDTASRYGWEMVSEIWERAYARALGVS